MSDIFLSYASEDRERVRPLAEALIQMGWSVFWDRIIPVGKPWHELLEEELEAARSLLIVWSENSIKSKWVRAEANEGLRKELPLFPVLLDEVMPPLGFRDIQAGDFSKWDGSTESAVFQNLIRDIKKILVEPTVTKLGPVAQKPPEPPQPKPPKPIRINWTVLVAVIAGLALIVLLVWRQVVPPHNIPPPNNCEALRKERRNILTTMRELDERLKVAQGRERDKIIAEFKKLDERLIENKRKLKNCPQ